MDVIVTSLVSITVALISSGVVSTVLKRSFDKHDRRDLVEQRMEKHEQQMEEQRLLMVDLYKGMMDLLEHEITGNHVEVLQADLSHMKDNLLERGVKK